MLKKKTPILISLLVSLILGIGFGCISIFYFKTIKNEHSIAISKDFKNKVKFNIHKNINKYKLIENTTNYVNYLETGVFKFDSAEIKKNLYSFMIDVVKRETNFNESTYKINLNTYYHLNFNNDYLKILVNWTTKPINSLNSEFVKQYYDVFDVSIRKN